MSSLDTLDDDVNFQIFTINVDDLGTFPIKIVLNCYSIRETKVILKHSESLQDI